MAVITDQEALQFVEEVIRPMASWLRGFEALAQSAEARWFNGPNAILTGTDTVENDPTLPALTGTECANIITAIMAGRDVVTETAGRAALIEKACRQVLQVTR